MKKTLVSLSLCALVALGATSCKKDIEQNKGGHQFRATMENCSSSDSKTTLSGSNINWNAGDEVMIYGKEQTGLYTAQPGSPATTATLVNVDMPAQGIPYTAIYPAALANSATSVSLPAEQVTVDGNLISNFPMYAKTTDENLAFKNLFGALKLHLQQEGATVSRIVVTADREINGNFDIDNSGDAPVVSYVDGGIFSTTLVCTEPQDISNGHDFFVTLPAGTYTNLTISIQNAGYGVEKHSPAGASITIERSRYFTLGFQALNMPIPPEEGIWGLFSVSATQQVWIATGNLQFNKTFGTYPTADQRTLNGTWRFAENQYDHCGYNGHLGNVEGGNNSSATAWIDLFGWATSGYNGYEPLPRNTYNHYVDFPADEIGGTNYDWGVNIGDGWRTLNKAEWQCLVGSVGHVDARNGKFAGATVCGVQGYLLLPDIWNGPAINLGKPYTTNVYDAEAWAEMESFGAAFLPFTGRKSGGSVYINHNDGYYWTTTANGYADSGRKLATPGNFSSTGGIGTGNCECEGQCAVRLCKNYVPAN